ncbi:hypothetical protein DWX45_16485 [Erysipelotrichaceae bacterium AF19-24AC]|jgi:hypothetical protein|nr:hypothetical protein DWX45_16485 [Erysipelotrichaceae bacterium AF19-24AC]
MLDVNAYLERTEEVKLPDKVLQVYEPTHNMYLAALQHEDADKMNDYIEYQIEAVTAMLNRNKEGVKVKKTDIEDLPRSFIVAVYRALMMMCNEALSDPN